VLIAFTAEVGSKSEEASARNHIDRTRAKGKSRRESTRCLKRLLTRTVFNTLKTSTVDIGATLAQPAVVPPGSFTPKEQTYHRFLDAAQ
jgi:hypothetical protein